MTIIPSRRDKCTGAFLASAIGDALGWQFELNSGNTLFNRAKNEDHFNTWTRRAGGRYWSHNETIYAGEYSDDTQLILAVSRSLISGDWIKFLEEKELPFWLSYERGGGRALKAAAQTYRRGEKPWLSAQGRLYFSAGGNGAAMRILPHVVNFSPPKTAEELIREVCRDCIITHGHPRAIIGAACYAYALLIVMERTSTLEFGEMVSLVAAGANVWGTFYPDALPDDWLPALQHSTEYSFDEVWDTTVKHTLEQLTFIANALKQGILVNDQTVLTELGCLDRERGAGDNTVLAAIYLASKYANNPILGIKTAAYSIGIDTDTVASITGGLLGMLCGTAWIPTEWRLVQDYHCICNVSEILCSSNPKEATRQLSATIANKSTEFINSPIGKLKTIAVNEFLIGKNKQVTITKMESLLGQTIYHKHYEKIVRAPADSEFGVRTPISQSIHAIPNRTLDIPKLIQLKNDPLFARISFKKVLQIVEMLENGKFIPSIAQKSKTSQELVQKIQQCIS